jgi:hypothetical protein
LRPDNLAEKIAPNAKIIAQMAKCRPIGHTRFVPHIFQKIFIFGEECGRKNGR